MEVVNKTLLMTTIQQFYANQSYKSIEMLRLGDGYLGSATGMLLSRSCTHKVDTF